MSTLRSLRSITNLWDSSKARDDQNATTLNLQSEQSRGTVKRQRLHKSSQRTRPRTNLLNTSINTQSTSTLRTEHPDRPLTELRRRLARKASTFSLRNRRRQGEREQAEEAKEKEKLRELVLVGNDKGCAQSEQEEHSHNIPHLEQIPNELGKAAKPQECQTDERQFSRESSVTRVRVWDPASDLLVKDLPPVPPTSDPSGTLLPLPELIRKGREAYTTKNIAGGKITIKRMASEQAAPPVPYTQLKEITEHVSPPPTIAHPKTLAGPGLMSAVGLRDRTFGRDFLLALGHGKVEHHHHQQHFRGTRGRNGAETRRWLISGRPTTIQIRREQHHHPACGFFILVSG